MTIWCLSNYADQCMPIIAHFLLEWIPPPPAQHIAKWSIQNTRQQIFKCIFNQNNKSKTKIHSLYMQALYISTTFTTPISLSKFGGKKLEHLVGEKGQRLGECVLSTNTKEKKKWKQILIFVKTQLHNCYLHTPGFRIMKTKTIFITNTNTISNTNTNTYERLLHCNIPPSAEWQAGRWAPHGTMNLFSSPTVCVGCDIVYWNVLFCTSLRDT